LCGVCNLGTATCAGGVFGACVYPPPKGTLDLSATIRDLKSNTNPMNIPGHIDFQNKLGTDKGIVKALLGADGTPDYAHDAAGTATTHGPDRFFEWFHDAPNDGQNANQSKTIMLSLGLVGGSNPPRYVYDNQAFFPIDNDLFGNQGFNHNFSFTVQVHTKFLYSGSEVFQFDGDDDVWVFINGQLAIDLGGVHSTQSQKFDLKANAAAFGLTECTDYPLDLFFAERHTTQSDIRIDTTLVLRQQLRERPVTPGWPAGTESAGRPDRSASAPTGRCRG
jgi:fibro-slime domain-containing protein